MWELGFDESPNRKQNFEVDGFVNCSWKVTCKCMIRNMKNEQKLEENGANFGLKTSLESYK